MANSYGLSRSARVGMRSEERVHRLFDERAGEVPWILSYRESTPEEDLDGIDFVVDVENVGELFVQVKSSKHYEQKFLRGLELGYRGLTPIVTVNAGRRNADDDVWETMINRLNKKRKLFFVLGDRAASAWMREMIEVNQVADRKICRPDNPGAERLMQVLQVCDWKPPFVTEIEWLYPMHWGVEGAEYYGIQKAPVIRIFLDEEVSLLVRTVTDPVGHERLQQQVQLTRFEPFLMIELVPEQIDGEWLAGFFGELAERRERMLALKQKLNERLAARLET